MYASVLYKLYIVLCYGSVTLKYSITMCTMCGCWAQINVTWLS